MTMLTAHVQSNQNSFDELDRSSETSHRHYDDVIMNATAS